MRNCQLQQYLPFTVLKPSLATLSNSPFNVLLQQYLPFTVLKHIVELSVGKATKMVATVPTVYGIETIHTLTLTDPQQSVATVPTVYGIETRSLLN